MSPARPRPAIVRTAERRGRDRPSEDRIFTIADAVVVLDGAAKEHGLVPGEAPSTTVAIVRWDRQVVDVLLLGDSVVVALTRTGAVSQLRDDRLGRVAVEERDRSGAGGFGSRRDAEWRSLVDAERAQRNRPGGYWIAEAVP